jgi:hypothetical protein
MVSGELRSKFSVVVFDHLSAHASELADYLHIYIQNLTPDHRTKTNELVDFLANPLPGQQIFYFGLRYRGHPCGMATLMVYADVQVGIIDHIAIAATERGFGAFTAFCENIADYVEKVVCRSTTLSRRSSLATISRRRASELLLLSAYANLRGFG